MDRTARQALFIMIENIEKQLVGVKALLGMTVQDDFAHRSAKVEENRPMNYTTQDDDKELEKGLQAALEESVNEQQRFMDEISEQV